MVKNVIAYRLRTGHKYAFTRPLNYGRKVTGTNGYEKQNERTR